MALPDSVITKIEIYTLACRELMERLEDLQLATQTSTRVDIDKCLKCSDSVLNSLFRKSSPKDSREAAKLFGNLLRAEIDLFRSLNNDAAAIFDDVITAVQTGISSWHYYEEFQKFHADGRQLAQMFFDSSSHTELRRDLGRECHLLIEYGRSDEIRQDTTEDAAFGNRLAPLAYYKHYFEYDDVVLARFTFEHNFTLYLSYLFLFLHEYTAHVYANDYGNERFNDGWMLHAASAFLMQEWSRANTKLCLSIDQVNIFYEYLYPRLNPIPRRACCFARDFDSWLSAKLPRKFIEITYELATFEPRNTEKETWPTQFINALEHEFRKNRQMLMEKIEVSSNIRELMKQLHRV